MGEDGHDPPGIDGDRVGQWFEAHAGGAVELPLRFARIEGGLSNLTYHVCDGAGRRWVLRRPPLHGVIQSAHDMAREHRIIAALADSDVPVPPVVGHCDDEDVTGAEFYVMDFVPGPVYRTAQMVEAETDQALRRRIAMSLIDTLAALHEVDPDAVGLGDLGRRADYCARQLRRWRRQWEHVATSDLPAFVEVHERLCADVPAQTGVAIVHGDYRLDNLILSPDGDVAAVVDWELCTLGDPLADVGILCAYWADPDDTFRTLPQASTHLPGFLRRGELVDRYAERSGRDVSDIAFYLALAYWRLAAILQGVYSRFASGAYGRAHPDIESFPQRIERLVDAAHAMTVRSGH
ncbi:MAG: phosphotransferase family protein [Actinobacteria bacterium]|nr:phosphotransferase family protein [Actinomycetota bacterium]